MDCPVCKNEPMIVLELNEVEIDYCLSCKGIWLDAGELELLLESSTETIEFLNSFTIDDQTKEKKLKCPICNKKMEKILVIGNKKVRIDKCNANHGIWFDSGELENILKMASLGKDDKVLVLLKDMFGHKKL
ncbi:MAG: zf-TFIIB domain-containing protein [Candidatus Cloacimonadota bacterium]|nr:zf-TFIIB domain-containing protein [Candidatus Cloacimonadota bacterium]